MRACFWPAGNMPTPAAAGILDLHGCRPRLGRKKEGSLLLLVAVLLMPLLLGLELPTPGLAGCIPRPYVGVENAGLLEMHCDWQLVLLDRALGFRHCILNSRGLLGLMLQRSSDIQCETLIH
jgi:hypothetical protein